MPHPKGMRPKGAQSAEPPSSGRIRTGVFFLWAGWILGMFGILATHNFHFTYKALWQDPFVPMFLIQWTFFGGLILLATGSRLLPDLQVPDTDRRTAGWLLGLFLVAAMFLVFYSGNRPMGRYWNDFAQNTLDARNMLDFNNYRLIYDAGGREGFHMYLMALIWAILPSLNALWVSRLAAGVVVLTTVWVSYLVGVELGSRRKGLFLAALTAAGKPLLHQALMSMRIETQIMATAIACLMFLRVARRPDLRRFLAVGLAMGFGAYTYTGFWAWVVILPWVFLAFLLTRKGELTAGWHVFFLPPMLAWLEAYYFIGKQMKPKPPLFEAMTATWASNLALRIAFFMVLLLALAQAWRVLKKSGTGRWVTGWSFATLTMLVCVVPLTWDHCFNDHLMSATIALSHEYQDPIVPLLKKVLKCFHNMFLYADDKMDCYISIEPYLDFYSMAAVLLGFLAWVGRPNRVASLFVVLALAGCVPYIMTSDIANTKFLGAVIPLYALGALAADRLFSGTASLARGPWARRLAALVLLSLFGTGVYIQFQKFHVVAMNEEMNAVLLYRFAGDVTQRGGRAYLATPEIFWDGISQSVLQEGHLVFHLVRSNRIELNDDEPVPPIVVLANCRGKEEALRPLRQAFPRSRWVGVPFTTRIPERYDPCIVYRIEVDPADLQGGPGSLMYIQRVTGKPWVRRYYTTFYGSHGRGMIFYEDRAAKAGDPWNPAYKGLNTVEGFGVIRVMRATGPLHAEKGGVYRFQVDPIQDVWLRVDGRLVADLPSRRLKDGIKAKVKTVRVRLKAGEHKVEYGVFLRYGDWTEPTLRLLRPGSETPEAF